MNLKWGVLGAGSVAQRRAMPAITKANNAELHALLSRDTTRAETPSTRTRRNPRLHHRRCTLRRRCPRRNLRLNPRSPASRARNRRS